MTDQISSERELEHQIGKPPGPRDMKVIDFLDQHAQRWLSWSPFSIVFFGGSGGLVISAASGEPGFTIAESDKRLRLPRDAVDEHLELAQGDAFASLYLIPGMRETLRINGVVEDRDATTVTLRVRECYLHCGKALMRSEFWAPRASSKELNSFDRAIAASRLLALGSINSAGEADVSPKGDPAGALLKFINDELCYPDRPGNRRIDSFRNIVSQPRVAMLAFVPGAHQVLKASGIATISATPELRGAFTVQERTPTLVTRVTIDDVQLYESSALARAPLWPTPAPPEELHAATIFRDHVKLSKERGVAASLARAAVSVPGFMERGLNSDYKNNLY